MKIGLLGAAFDPPHYGHWQVTETLLSSGRLDEVWWVPVQQHPYAKHMSPAIHRLAMVELALRDHLAAHPELATKVKINTSELQTKQVSYSILTLDRLSQDHPDHQFSWIIGADNLAGFDRWQAYERILKYGVWVYPRPGFELTPILPGMNVLHDVPEVELSSTQIRSQAAEHHGITDLVTTSVAQYIKDQALYET